MMHRVIAIPKPNPNATLTFTGSISRGSKGSDPGINALDTIKAIAAPSATTKPAIKMAGSEWRDLTATRQGKRESGTACSQNQPQSSQENGAVALGKPVDQQIQASSKQHRRRKVADHGDACVDVHDVEDAQFT